MLQSAKCFSLHYGNWFGSFVTECVEVWEMEKLRPPSTIQEDIQTQISNLNGFQRNRKTVSKVHKWFQCLSLVSLLWQVPVEMLVGEWVENVKMKKGCNLCARSLGAFNSSRLILAPPPPLARQEDLHTQAAMPANCMY